MSTQEKTHKKKKSSRKHDDKAARERARAKSSGGKTHRSGKSGKKRRRAASGFNPAEFLKIIAWLAVIAVITGAALFLLPEIGSHEASSVVIYRVMTSNPATCLSVDGEYYDWIELRNTGYADVNLAGWKLSDDTDLRGAFEFDDMMIPARGSLVVYCDKAPEGFAGDEVFVGFRLSSDGETLILSSADESSIDVVEVPAMGSSYVWQRDMEAGGYRVISFFEIPEDDAEYAARLTPKYEDKSLFMRASGQDAFQTHMRDSILTSLAQDTGVMYQETEVSVVYINGEYWGVYNMRERISPYSLRQFHDWDDNAYLDVLEGSFERMYATSGAEAPFQELLTWVKRNDLRNDANVQKLSEAMDIENYLDYVALQIYTSNQDLNNVRLYRNRHGDNKWRWVLCDLDLSYQVDANSISRWMADGGVGSITKQDNTLFVELMENAKVRDYFLTRMGELLATTFSTENVLE